MKKMIIKLGKLKGTKQDKHQKDFLGMLDTHYDVYGTELKLLDGKSDRVDYGRDSRNDNAGNKKTV